jgi:crotonobetainyl-CoA:carnitine CoA-transferase CaiB-like acyl-CoA transferase
LYREGQRRSIAIAPVNTIADVAVDPQLDARDAWVEMPVPALGATARYPAPPYRLSVTPPRIAGPAPAIGEHNADVLRDELGLSDEAYRALDGEGTLA